MSKLPILFSLLFIIPLAQSTDILDATGAKGRTVIVQRFENKTKLDPQLLKTLEIAFENKILELGKLIPVERNILGTMLTEQKLIVSGLCEQKRCIVKIGELTGAAYIIATTVSAIGSRYILQARLIDITTTAVSRYYNTAVLGVGEESLPLEVERAAYRMSGLEDETISGTMSDEDKVRDLLAPKVETGYLTVSSNPKATVYWGTSRLGQTPRKNEIVSAGPHTLSIDRSGYRRIVLDIDLKPGQHLSRHFDLPRLTGTLRITSDPPGVKVMSGADELGTTPLLLERRSLGKHTFLLLKDGYHKQKIEVIAHPLQETVSDSTLEPYLVPLLLTSKLKEVMVSVDGEQVGEVGDKLMIKPGWRKIVFSKPEYYDQVVETEVPVITPLQLEVQLVPYSKVTFEYEPPDAEFRIDGKETCDGSPCVLMLQEGKYAITMTKERYRKLETEIEIGRDEIIRSERYAMKEWTEYDVVATKLAHLVFDVAEIRSSLSIMEQEAALANDDTFNKFLNTFWFGRSGETYTNYWQIGFGAGFAYSFYLFGSVFAFGDLFDESTDTMVADSGGFDSNSGTSYGAMFVGICIDSGTDIYYNILRSTMTSNPYTSIIWTVFAIDTAIKVFYLTSQDRNAFGPIYSREKDDESQTAMTARRPKDIKEFYLATKVLLVSALLKTTLNLLWLNNLPSRSTIAINAIQKKKQEKSDKEKEIETLKKKLEDELQPDISFAPLIDGQNVGLGMTYRW